MTLFTIYGLFTKMLYDGDERKKPEIYKRRNKGKNSQFGCPPIPPSTKWRPTVFRCPKTPKTNPTYPKWERVHNLMGGGERKKKDRVGRGMDS